MVAGAGAPPAAQGALGQALGQLAEQAVEVGGAAGRGAPRRAVRHDAVLRRPDREGVDDRLRGGLERGGLRALPAAGRVQRVLDGSRRRRRPCRRRCGRPPQRPRSAPRRRHLLLGSARRVARSDTARAASRAAANASRAAASSGSCSGPRSACGTATRAEAAALALRACSSRACAAGLVEHEQHVALLDRLRRRAATSLATVPSAGAVIVLVARAATVPGASTTSRRSARPTSRDLHRGGVGAAARGHEQQRRDEQDDRALHVPAYGGEPVPARRRLSRRRQLAAAVAGSLDRGQHRRPHAVVLHDPDRGDGRAGRAITASRSSTGCSPESRSIRRRPDRGLHDERRRPPRAAVRAGCRRRSSPRRGRRSTPVRCPTAPSPRPAATRARARPCRPCESRSSTSCRCSGAACEPARDRRHRLVDEHRGVGHDAHDGRCPRAGRSSSDRER